MAKEEGKRKLTNPLAVLGKYKYVLLVAVLGGLLLLWPMERKDGAAAPAGAEPAAGTDLAQTEKSMADILGKIEGVGRVEVMLTLHSGGERVLAQDSSLRYSGSAQAPDSYERSSQPVTDAGGVVVTHEKYPQYRGALVVCEGGGNDAVRFQVVSAVSALTGLGSDRIAVVKWQDAAAAGAAEREMIDR